MTQAGVQAVAAHCGGAPGALRVSTPPLQRAVELGPCASENRVPAGNVENCMTVNALICAAIWKCKVPWMGAFMQMGREMYIVLEFE
jgi:hypothetical protein